METRLTYIITQSSVGEIYTLQRGSISKATPEPCPKVVQVHQRGASQKRCPWREKSKVCKDSQNNNNPKQQINTGGRQGKKVRQKGKKTGF